MSCKTTNWKKRKDIEYMSFMANMFSKNTGKEIGIYEKKIDGVGKIYDFEEKQEGKKYVKVVRFNKHVVSKDVLSDNEGEGLHSIDNIGESDTGTVDGDVDEHSGGVLQEEQPEPIPSKSKKGKKNSRVKK